MSVVCFGELLIDFVSQEHGVSVGDAPGFKKAPGGAPANVAVAVARLGYDVAFIGQVGDDPFGHFLAGVLEQDGINTQGLALSKTANTVLAFVSLTKSGERSFSFYGHPGEVHIAPEDLRLDVLDGRKVFHFGSITTIRESGHRATLAAVQAALARGLFISYDPNLRLSLWPSAEAAKTGMLQWFEFAHLIKISDEELHFLTRGDDPAPLWRDRTQVICVTRGGDGASIYTRDGKRIDVAGFKVATLDTTGAGDAFVAGMLAGVLQYGDQYTAHLTEITRFACAVGALATTQLGAIPSLPTRAAAEAFIAAHG